MGMQKHSIATYYKIAIDDSDPKALRGVEKNIRGFDPFRFYQGKLIEDWPKGISFSYTRGEHAEDYLFGGAYWILVSERIHQVFVHHKIEGAQFLPAKVTHKKIGKEVGKYWVLNVVQEAEALDWENTLWSTSDPKELEKWPSMHILREALIWKQVRNLDIFRLRIRGESGFGVLLSSRLKQYIEEAGATSGFLFFPIPAY